jgi:hypothetical protein
LFHLLSDKFIMRLDAEEDDDEDDDDDEGDDDQGEQGEQGEEDEEDEPDWEILPQEVVLENKRKHPVFSRLFRSKGHFFLATRPHCIGVWSQAGAILTMQGGMPWKCLMDPSTYLTGDDEADKIQLHDIAKGGEWGDRRQELVFIGERLQKQKLKALLDECLLTDEEFGDWEQVMRNDETNFLEKMAKLEDMFDDRWPAWQGFAFEGEDDENDEAEGEGEEAAKEEEPKLHKHIHAHHGHDHSHVQMLDRGHKRKLLAV